MTGTSLQQAYEYARALQLQPSWSQQWHGRYLLATNRAAEAENEYRRFQKMMPFSTWGTLNFAQFLFLTGRYPAAASSSNGSPWTGNPTILRPTS